MDVTLARMKLLLYCTLRGAVYGFLSGAFTGLFFFVIGAVIGAPVGIAVGLLFGFLHGAAVLAFVISRSQDVTSKEFRRNVYLCCLLTSLALDGCVYLLNGVTHTNDFLKVVSIIGLPSLIVSSLCLARFAANWYPRQVMIKPVPYRVEEAPEVWPPTPHAP